MCANFLTPERSVTLGEIAGWVGGQLVKGGDDFIVCGAGTLDDADGDQISFLDNPRYSQALPKSRAGACLVREKNLGLLPAHMHPCVVDSPYIAWADILTRLYPQSDNLSGIAPSISDRAVISASAKLEPGCIIEPGVVIGKDVQIGSGSRIGANTVVCQNVCIGRNCYIGPNCTIQYALIGDFVAIHPGVCVGQDGFGFAQGAKGHRKVPQIGRVIVQDHVEIGANTTIDRGAVNDTIIGEGTKIDNQVQIGHNVVIGCHCLIVAQVGIAGSTRLGDFVAIGGQAGIKGHCHIGSYAQIGASSGVGGNVAKGARYGGYPARPLDQWLKQIKWLNRQISGK